MLQKYFWFFLAVLAALVALYNFQTSPGFWFDEGIMAQASKNIALEGIYGIQTAPGEFYTNNFWVTTGYPVVLPTALFLKIFGISVWAARLTPLIYLILFVAVSYFFVKKLYGFEVAVLAGLLLITFPPLYGNGKALLGEIPGLFWFVLGALFYLLYEEKDKSAYFYASGLVFGLSVATKPYFVLIIPGIAFLTLFSLFKRRIDFRLISVFWAVFFIPILAWAFLAFDFSSLPTLKATLVYFFNSYGAVSFEPLKNLFRFVSESTPIHFTVLAVSVFASFFISLKNKNFRPLIAVFLIFIIFAFLWYLKTPGWYRYFFPAHVILILFFPVALTNIMNRFSAIAVLSALIIFQTVFLFLNYNDLYGDDVLVLEAYAKDSLGGGFSVFVDSLPEAGFVIESKNLYQYIFISKNFEIGQKLPDFATDYLISGSGKSAGSEYVLSEEIGHYGIYQKKQD